MKELPKYEYYLHTWGGFYNDEHVTKHGITEKGDFWFDTKEEREIFLKRLQDAEKKYNARMLAFYEAEGYDIREHPIIHRIVEYKGKKYYSTNEWPFVGEEFSTLMYHAAWKWYPGFNDYIIEEETGEEIDYDQIQIIQEWITGSFIINTDEV